MGQAAVKERVAWFGDEENLVAIVSDPAVRQPGPDLLILNAGVLHRVGPHRLHVNLARALAGLGRRATRVDLSGIGDSRPLPGRMTFRESSVADIRSTLDSLTAEGGSSDFIVFGICSGADNALAAAEADPRIRGLVLVDPPAYATARSQARQSLGGASGVQAWLRLLLRFGRSALRRIARTFKKSSPAKAHTGGRETPPVEEYRRQLNALVARNVRILAIYSGVLGARFNHEDQLFETFPELRGKVQSAFFPNANHTFTELSAQADLQALVVRWCESWH